MNKKHCGTFSQCIRKLKASLAAQIVWIALMIIVHVIIYKSKIEVVEILVRIIYAILAIVITLPLHELCHYVLWTIFSKGKAKIELGIDPAGVPGLKTSVHAALTWKQKLIGFMAPLFFLTIIPDIIFMFSENIYLFFFIMSMINAAGCYYDVLDTVITIAKKK